MGERVRTLLRIINWESLKSLKIGIIIILIQYQVIKSLSDCTFKQLKTLNLSNLSLI